MMDFEGRSQGGFEPENQDDFSNELAQAQAAAVPRAGLGTERVIQPGPDNTVVLPAGADLEGFSADGRDLIITLEDGSVIRIPDGAIVVPQFVIDGVAIPPQTIAALLTGNEPQPEAGNPQSSGGNFAGDVGDIQAAYALGDLLPYTELSRPQYTDEEVIPGLVDRDPDIVVVTPDNPVGAVSAIATVDEEGLPARTVNGTDETPGTAAETNVETTSGTIVFSAPDGAQSVLINGVAITNVGQTFQSPDGTLTITSIDLANGRIGFSYTLGDNLLGRSSDDFFTMTVIDRDGDRATASLRIDVIDDQPIARVDSGTVPGGTFGPITGNVVTNDTPGADGYGLEGAVTGFSNSGGSAEPGDTLTGTYGELTLNADGTYSYTRFFNTPGGVSEQFTYNIVDGDGSTATAILTINIADAPNDITFVPGIGDGTLVNESELPSDTATRTDEPEGSVFDGNPETTTGTINFVSPDGVASVSIGGTIITPDSLPQTVFTDGTGTLVVTGYTYNPETGLGSITYTYTLTDNTENTDGTTVTFPIVVTDLDGDRATDDLVITIVDDAPTAVDDSATQASENASITVNVIANDTTGADGVDLANDVALVEGTLSGKGTLTYNGDGTFTYVPAPGEEGEVTFDYVITDGDGDTATATVTIGLLEDSTPTISVTGDNDVEEAALGARPGEPAGSNAASDGETATGSINITTGNDSIGTLVINGVDVTNGGTVTTTKGVLTITVTNGAYSYSYTLSDNTLSDPDSDTFQLTVTDSDGEAADSATTTLVISIIDDKPSAENDSGSLDAGTYGPIGGNVLANDTQGADGATVTSYSGPGGSGATGESIDGTYGKLTIAADGTYSYTRNAGTPGGVKDTFTYTITDGDTDTATAQLVIAIENSTTTLDLPTEGEDGTQVDEAGLAGPPAGSDAANDGEFTSGTFTYTAPDGPGVVTIDGVEVTTVGQTFAGAFGTMTITAIAEGSISYTYELETNTSGDNTQDSFTVRVTDQDGDFTEGELEIAIADDEPAANTDSDSVTEDGPLVADGNVLTGTGGSDANTSDGVADVPGADGAAVTLVTFGTETANAGEPLVLDYGTLTIDANGDYVYTLDNNNPLVQGLDKNQTLTETVTYTITDGDTDTTTAQLIITINGQDDPVVINDLSLTDPEGLVDEDDLPDGSDTTPESLVTSGTFSVDAQDGLTTLTIGGTAVFGDGVTYPVLIDGEYGQLRITGVTPVTDASGDTVSVTVTWEFELSQNTLDHTVVDAQDPLLDSFDVVATDTDGSSASSVLDIQVIDDVPSAVGDTAGQANENEAFTIDALDNDVFGADGVDTTNIEKVFVSTQAAQGTVTYDPATGLFTYTPDAGAGSGGNTSDFFEYTIVDRDGDTSTARVDVTLQPDSEPTGGSTTALLDDDGLGGGNADSDTDDLDANFGDDPADTSEASFTGTLVFNVFNDTPAAITFDPALNGSTASIGVETVTYSVVGNVLTATVTGGVRDGTDLFTVELTDSATGDYKVTLLDNVLHAPGSNENDATTSIGFVVRDSEGEPATTTLNITFDDDAPTATNNSASVTEGGTTGGNVLTDDNGSGVDAAGADGYGLNGAIIRIDSVNEGTNDTSVDAEGNLVLKGEFGTLTINVNTGVYKYVSDANSTNVDAPDTFTYTIVDGDGDQATANLVINVENVAGIVTDNDVSVDEKGLPTGTGELADGDAGNNDDQSEIDTDGQISVNGASGTLTYILVGGTFSDGGTAGDASDDTYTVDGTYGTIVLNASTGAYTYTLDTDFSHDAPAGAADQNTAFAAEGFDYRVEDDLGNEIGTGTINVNIVDDIPIAVDDANSVTEGLGNTTGGNVFDAENASAGDNADTIGADGPTAGTEVTGVRSGAENTGDPLVSVGASQTVSGIYGDLTINDDGTYTYELTVKEVPLGATDTFTYQITDGDGDTDLAELVITINQDLRVPDIAGDAVTVYEDGLADGVQYGADSETALGSFLVTDNGEGVTFTLKADNGNTLTDPAVNDTLTTTKGVLTITGIVDNNDGTVTYNYSYTLSAALTHEGQGEGTDLTDTIAMAISDDTGDSDATPGSIVITIVDDVPIGVNEGEIATVDDNASGVNIGTAAGLIANDNFGADGQGTPAITNIATGSLGGTVTIDGSGNLLYTSATNITAPYADQVETFTYTIVDGDGDTTTATFQVRLTDEGPAINADAATFTVDEEGLGGNAGNGDSSGDVAGEVTQIMGTLSGIDFGVDGAGSITLVAVADTGLVTLAGNAVETVWDGTTLTGQDSVTGADVFTLTITNVATGAYTFTLLAPVKHTDAASEDDADFTIDVIVADAEGETAQGAISITIDDDSPIGVNEGEIATVDDNASGVNIGTAAGLIANDNFGADGQGTPAITNIATGSLGGTVTIDGSGNLLYTSATNITAPYADQVETFTYTIVDGDGDTTTATFQVRLTDDGPAINANAATFTVDEEGLGGNAGNGVSSGDVAGEATVQTGFLAGLDFGTDGPGGIVLTAVADTTLNTLNGDAIATVWDPNTLTLTGYDSTAADPSNLTAGDIYFTLVITDVATGAYTFTLTQPVQHPDGTSEDDQSFTVGVVVSDAEGETANGTISITIDDDSPVPTISAAGLSISHDETPGLDGDAQDVSGPLAEFAGVVNPGNDPHAPGAVIGYARDASGLSSAGSSLGADGAGSTTFSLGVSSAGVDSGLDTTAGQNILLFKEGNLIVGRVGSQAGEAAFAIAVDASTGAVSMVQYLSIKHPTGGLSSPDESVSIAADAIRGVVTVVDGDGDTHSAQVGIGGSISFQDDAGSLGAFGSLLVPNTANAMDFGTFTYTTGSDGHATFNITGPALTGVVYQPLVHGMVDATDDGINNPVAGTTLTATNAAGTVTLFTLALDENGNSKFTLVTPDAGDTQTISLLGLTPGGPTPFVQTPDGRIEFSANGNGVNSSTQGFGVSNQFVEAGQFFTIEFHNPGQPGDQAPLVNADFVSSAILTNDGSGGGQVVYRITVFNDADNTSEVVYLGKIPGASTFIDPTTLDTFNRILVEGVSGKGQGARFTAFSFTKNILPSDLDLNFQITATDGDGDVTSTSSINVLVDADAPASMASSGQSVQSLSALSPMMIESSTFGSANDNTLNGLRTMGMTSILAAASGIMMDTQVGKFGSFEVYPQQFSGSFDGFGFQAMSLADTAGPVANFDMGGFDFAASTISIPANSLQDTSFGGFEMTQVSGLIDMAQGHTSGFAMGQEAYVEPMMVNGFASAVPMGDSMSGMEALLMLGDLAGGQAGPGGLALAGDPAAALADLGAEAALDMAIDYFATSGPLGGMEFGGTMGGNTFTASMLDTQVGALHAAGMGPDMVQDAALVLETAAHA